MRSNGPARTWRAALQFLCIVFLSIAASAHAQQTVLYEKASLYSNIIVTEDPDGVRVLRFERGGAQQSRIRPGDPDYIGLAYARVAFAGLALTPEPKRILVVGLGGGTLPMFLHKYYPSAVIDAVDIDPDVVDVARKFFGFKDDDYMRAHVADGRGFIEQTKEPYDIIFLDAFGASSVPPHMTTQEFLRAVRKAVKPTGVVVGNIWASHLNRIYDSMVRTYQEVFDELYILEVRGTGNMMLFAVPRKENLTPAQLEKTANGISRSRKMNFDLGNPQGYIFNDARQKNTAGHVLTDREMVERRP